MCYAAPSAPPVIPSHRSAPSRPSLCTALERIKCVRCVVERNHQRDQLAGWDALRRPAAELRMLKVGRAHRRGRRSAQARARRRGTDLWARARCGLPPRQGGREPAARGQRHQTLRYTGHLERGVDAGAIGPGLHDLSHVGGQRINRAQSEAIGGNTPDALGSREVKTSAPRDLAHQRDQPASRAAADNQDGFAGDNPPTAHIVDRHRERLRQRTPTSSCTSSGRRTTIDWSTVHSCCMAPAEEVDTHEHELLAHVPVADEACWATATPLQRHRGDRITDVETCHSFAHSGYHPGHLVTDRPWNRDRPCGRA